MTESASGRSSEPQTASPSILCIEKHHPNSDGPSSSSHKNNNSPLGFPRLHPCTTKPTCCSLPPCSYNNLRRLVRLLSRLKQSSDATVSRTIADSFAQIYLVCQVTVARNNINAILCTSTVAPVVVVLPADSIHATALQISATLSRDSHPPSTISLRSFV